MSVLLLLNHTTKDRGIKWYVLYNPNDNTYLRENTPVHYHDLETRKEIDQRNDTILPLKSLPNPPKTPQSHNQENQMSNSSYQHRHNRRTNRPPNPTSRYQRTTPSTRQRTSLRSSPPSRSITRPITPRPIPIRLPRIRRQRRPNHSSRNRNRNDLSVLCTFRVVF